MKRFAPEMCLKHNVNPNLSLPYPCFRVPNRNCNENFCDSVLVTFTTSLVTVLGFPGSYPERKIRHDFPDRLKTNQAALNFPFHSVKRFNYKRKCLASISELLVACSLIV